MSDEITCPGCGKTQLELDVSGVDWGEDFGKCEACDPAGETEENVDALVATEKARADRAVEELRVVREVELVDARKERDWAHGEIDRLNASLAALRSRVNEVERERAKFEAHAKEGWDLANHRTRQWKQAERALETRDAEVARLRELLGEIRLLLRTGTERPGKARGRLNSAAVQALELARAALSTPEATTPAVPEPKEMP